MMKLKPRIIDHLIEAILIFTSVFLAFWLNDLRESKKERNTLEVSLKHIALEMDHNHHRIESVFAYHLQLVNEIDSLAAAGNEDWQEMYGNSLNSWQGVKMPMLRSTAYQTFIISGVSGNAKFELAKSLADIYNLQSIIERLDNTFVEEATTDRGITALPKMRHLSGLYVEILPDIINSYQHEGKQWLSEYGYALNITNEDLKR